MGPKLVQAFAYMYQLRRENKQKFISTLLVKANEVAHSLMHSLSLSVSLCIVLSMWGGGRTMPRRVRSTRRTTTSSIGPAGPATTLGGRAGGDRQCIYPSLLIVVSEIYNVRCPPYYTVVCCAHAFALVLAWAGPPTYLTVEGPEEMEG